MLNYFTLGQLYSIVGVFSILMLCNMTSQRNGLGCFFWAMFQSFLYMITGAIYQGFFVVAIYTGLYILFLLGSWKLLIPALLVMLLVRIWSMIIGPIEKLD